MSFRTLLLTGEQIRAARALVRVEQVELAKRCGLSLETIKRVERIRGPVDANIRTLSAISAAFEEMGVRFEGCENGGGGVCRPPAHRATPITQSERGSAASRPAEPLHRLMYFSTAAPKAMAAMKSALDEISETAGRRNIERGVTGALMACNGRFLQVIEGPKDSVHQVYGAVSSDPRHCALRVLESRAVASRQFPDWSLCCGVFASDEEMFRQEPAMADGFHPELLTPASAVGLLCVLRDLQHSPPRNGRGGAGPCPLADKCLDRVCAATAAKPLQARAVSEQPSLASARG